MENNNQNNQFEMMGADGERLTCQVLFTFHSDEWKAHYMVYMPVGDPTRISASRYIPEQLEKGTLSTMLPIETDEEWAFVESVINHVLSGAASN